MDASVVCRFIIFAVILAAALTSAQVITPPNNVTVKRGGWATFNCEMSSLAEVMWVRYAPGMEVLYHSSTKTQNLPEKYAVENSSSLVVKDTDFSDGVAYSCMDLSVEKRPRYANLVIMDDLEASVDPPNIVSFGDNITMTCSLNYGGPTHGNDVSPLSPDQDPRISIFFGNENLTYLASEVHIPASAGQPMHSKSLSINRTLTIEDVKKDLRCFVNSVKPVYGDSANLSLPFRYSPRTATIEVGANVTGNMRIFTGTLVNCSVDGIPAPRVTWTPVGRNPGFEILKAEPGYSTLRLVGAGFHNWNCTGSNTPGVAAQTYSEMNITVIDLPKPVESKAGSVGLGVGLGIGLALLVLLGVILLIFFLRKRKHSGEGKPNASKPNASPKKSLFGKKPNSSGVEKTAMIYKPQPTNETRVRDDTRARASPTNPNGITQTPNRSYERTSDTSQMRSSDKSGHADLGIKTLGASGSMPRLNESFDSMDERNLNRNPNSRNHSSCDDEQFYPSRYHKVKKTAHDPDTVV